MGELVLEFEDVAALERECADNLAHGRGFAAGAAAGVDMLADIDVVLVHPRTGDRLTLPARAVMVTDAGVGFEIADGGSDALSAWLAGPDPVDHDDDADGVRSASGRARAANAHERIKALTMPERQKLAQSGEQPDRIALERMCGKAVWEQLLRNPRITVPEVARIARKGTVPRPLLDAICENAAWARAPAVRRALLANPRLGRDAADKLLRVAPQPELKLIANQTTYPVAVRQAAKRLVKH